MSQAQLSQIILLDPSKLRHDPHDADLGDEMLCLVLLMIHVHQGLAKGELREELVHSHAHALKRVDRIVVLNQLVVRSTHPREAELAPNRRVNHQGEHLHGDLVNGIGFTLACRLQHLTEESDDILVDKVTEQVL